MGWVATPFYAMSILNPAGIAAGKERGIGSPELLFYNNTVATAMLGGWLYPALAVLIIALIGKVAKYQKMHKKAG